MRIVIMTAVTRATSAPAKTFNDLTDLARMLPRTQLHVDVDVPFLVECSIRRGEGILAENGALCVRTGERTGRSPKDRYIVEHSEISHLVDWGAVT
jgi:ATP-dependent phosphoenolpyruvate carboxykinase